MNPQQLKENRHRENSTNLHEPINELLKQKRIELECVLLFGSYMHGDFNVFSDSDLIVVDRKWKDAEKLAVEIPLSSWRFRNS